MWLGNIVVWEIRLDDLFCHVFLLESAMKLRTVAKITSNTPLHFPHKKYSTTLFAYSITPQFYDFIFTY